MTKGIVQPASGWQVVVYIGLSRMVLMEIPVQAQGESCPAQSADDRSLPTKERGRAGGAVEALSLSSHAKVRGNRAGPSVRRERTLFSALAHMVIGLSMCFGAEHRSAIDFGNIGSGPLATRCL